jgi:hypothetical protein
MGIRVIILLIVLGSIAHADPFDPPNAGEWVCPDGTLSAAILVAPETLTAIGGRDVSPYVSRWRVYANSASSSMLGEACYATTPVAKETSMPRPQPRHRQPDLFAPKNPPVPIAASERTKLLSLVSALLAEPIVRDFLLLSGSSRKLSSQGSRASEVCP